MRQVPQYLADSTGPMPLHYMACLSQATLAFLMRPQALNTVIISYHAVKNFPLFSFNHTFYAHSRNVSLPLVAQQNNPLSNRLSPFYTISREQKAFYNARIQTVKRNTKQGKQRRSSIKVEHLTKPKGWLHRALFIDIIRWFNKAMVWRNQLCFYA